MFFFVWFIFRWCFYLEKSCSFLTEKKNEIYRSIFQHICLMAVLVSIQIIPQVDAFAFIGWSNGGSDFAYYFCIVVDAVFVVRVFVRCVLTTTSFWFAQSIPRNNNGAGCKRCHINDKSEWFGWFLGLCLNWKFNRGNFHFQYLSKIQTGSYLCKWCCETLFVPFFRMWNWKLCLRYLLVPSWWPCRAIRNSVGKPFT